MTDSRHSSVMSTYRLDGLPVTITGTRREIVRSLMHHAARNKASITACDTLHDRMLDDEFYTPTREEIGLLARTVFPDHGDVALVWVDGHTIITAEATDEPMFTCDDVVGYAGGIFNLPPDTIRGAIEDRFDRHDDGSGRVSRTTAHAIATDVAWGDGLEAVHDLTHQIEQLEIELSTLRSHRDTIIRRARHRFGLSLGTIARATNLSTTAVRNNAGEK